jgi:hypothetical protein
MDHCSMYSYVKWNEAFSVIRCPVYSSTFNRSVDDFYSGSGVH